MRCGSCVNSIEPSGLRSQDLYGGAANSQPVIGLAGPRAPHPDLKIEHDFSARGHR